MLSVEQKTALQSSSYSGFLLVTTAESLGIDVSLVEGTDVYELSLNGKTEYLCRQWTSRLSYLAAYAAKHKDIAKAFLAEAGISVCPGTRCASYADAEAFARAQGFPLVLKPIRGSHGEQVHVGISDVVELQRVYEEMTHQTQASLLVEKQFVGGAEIRLLATRNRFLAAVERRPAHVIGDGVQTIRQLVEEKNRSQQRGEGHERALVRIRIASEELAVLASQGLDSDRVVQAGAHVFLRHNSNLSTGGDSIDRTDDLHQSVKDLAVRAIQALPGFPYGGIDFMTKDFHTPQTPETYTIIEVNHSPMVSMHHAPAEGTSRDVSRAILQELFASSF